MRERMSTVVRDVRWLRECKVKERSNATHAIELCIYARLAVIKLFNSAKRAPQHSSPLRKAEARPTQIFATRHVSLQISVLVVSHISAFSRCR